METPADDIRQLKAKIEQLERDRSATTSDALKIAFTSDIVAKENRLRVLQTQQGGSATVAELLQSMAVDVNANVVARMQQRYAAEVNNALRTNDFEHLRTIYERSAALPYTTTAAELSAAGTGFVLDGVLFSGNESLNVCFKEGVPHVLKVCTHTEYVRANEWMKACEDRVACPHIIGLETYCKGRDAGSKYFVFMRLHPITLEALPAMSATVLLRFFTQMSAALEFIHDTGFAHMDFKPSNILITSDGDFILADLGSIARVGSRSESTRAYLPREMCSRDVARPIASAIVDWWMMAVTMCEKVCGYDAGHGAESARESDIRSMLHELGEKEGAGVKEVVDVLLGRLA